LVADEKLTEDEKTKTDAVIIQQLQASIQRLEQSQQTQMAAVERPPEVGAIEPQVVSSCSMATTLQKLQLRYSSTQLQRVHTFISNPSEKSLTSDSLRW
jgi:triosephosphate isomerase